MTEYGELCHDLREYNRKKKARKFEISMKKYPQMLRDAGVDFEEHNCGMHLIIRTPKGVVNYWPTAGKYNGVVSGNDIRNLLRDLQGLGAVIRDTESK